ncbi:MAG: DUF5752 family protein [Elusimicrobia bacterium]|nr:DUF5752 family protein [Candidatus Obscuribacterium magneticum]
MTLKKTQSPFQFATQANLVELTGFKAHDLKELVEILKTAPGSVMYHHTHHFLKQHQFLSPEPTNDFAYWVSQVLQEDKLGEQLAAIDTVAFSSITELGNRILSVIQNYLEKNRSNRTAPEGEEFHFMKSQSFVLPTPYWASDLKEFLEAIKKISIHSLYHHIFEARLRLGRSTNDFSLWLEKELDEPALAKSISRMDPYTQTLDGLRQQIIAMIEQRLQSLAEEGPNGA